MAPTVEVAEAGGCRKSGLPLKPDVMGTLPRAMVMEGREMRGIRGWWD